MIYLNGHLARPLDATLGNGSRLAVLRALRTADDWGRGGREIARTAGINHQAAAQALRDLDALGLLQRRPSGRKILWSLDRRRRLVSEVLLPMLDGEARHAERIAAAIKAALKGKCRAALLIGAAAQGRLRAGAPLSLAAVESSGRRGLSDALRALKAELRECWALELDARIVNAREAARLAAVEEAWRLLPDEGRGFSGT